MGRLLVFVINPLSWLLGFYVCSPYLSDWTRAFIILFGLVCFYFCGIKRFLNRNNPEYSDIVPPPGPPVYVTLKNGKVIDKSEFDRQIRHATIYTRRQVRNVGRIFGGVAIPFIVIYFISNIQERTGWGEVWTPLQIAYVGFGVLAVVNIINECVILRTRPPLPKLEFNVNV